MTEKMVAIPLNFHGFTIDLDTIEYINSSMKTGTMPDVKNTYLTHNVDEDGRIGITLHVTEDVNAMGHTSFVLIGMIIGRVYSLVNDRNEKD